MRISVVQPTELSSSEIEAWQSMQHKTDSLVNPFLCPEFTLGVGRVKSAARVAVLADGSETIGFFPFERRRFGAGVAIGAGLSNCQGLVHSPGAEWDAHGLLRACKLSTWQFSKLVQDQKPFDNYAAGHALSAVIDLSNGFEAYYESLRLRSPRFLKSLNRRIRSLEKDAGELRFLGDSRDPRDLRSFISWKSDQCRRNGWLDIFARPWVMDLVDHLYATRNDSFGCTLSMLYAGETPIAGALDFQSGPYLAGWHCAYNPDFAKYSPGYIRHMSAVKHLAAAGVTTYELGDESYQERFKSSDVYFSKGTVTAGPLAAGVHHARARSEDWARHQIKRFPWAYRAADEMLQRMGRIA